MANEHIARKQAIGLGKESASGTPVAATAWIPKITGVFKLTDESAIDDAGYGVIDEKRDSQTVKTITEVEIEGAMRDKWFGNILLATFGTVTLCRIITITGQAGGNPARGDALTSATGTFVGVLQKVFRRGATTYYAVSVTSGVLTHGATDLTNGTWTGGTIGLFTNARAHFFTRLNTNAHPSYTIYGKDDVGTERAAYGMLDSLEAEAVIGDFVKFKSKWMAKKAASTSATPAYTDEYPFLAKHANMYLETAFASLEGATALAGVNRLRLSFGKNLTDIQSFGSTDITSFHNQQFTVGGDMEAVYNSTTLRDLVLDGTKKALRLDLINTDATILDATGLYPALIFDFPRVSLHEFNRTTNNNEIVKQTLRIDVEYDITLAATAEALLINGQTSAY